MEVKIESPKEGWVSINLSYMEAQSLCIDLAVAKQRNQKLRDVTENIFTELNKEYGINLDHIL